MVHIARAPAAIPGVGQGMPPPSQQYAQPACGQEGGGRGAPRAGREHPPCAS